MANAIVLEVLDFVRPIRLQVERISLSDVVRDAVSMAESHVPRGDVRSRSSCRRISPPIQGDPHQLRQLFTNLFTNAFEAMTGKGPVRLVAQQLPAEEEAAATSETHADADDPGGSRRQRARACRPMSWTGSSARFSRPNRKVPGLGWPSSGKSSMRMTGAST